ncbi:nuclear transport factor 2 family protein [Bradyrhizobium sp. SYSU BS000235]|uniref:nuclear transport factor 2 family protein n=1 Tax=Bradyrhizobium sp. SYSU BS000235 TaxID=3411332 RepID=UPI003C762734
MTDVLPLLAAPVQDTLAGWHRFVETKSEDVLRPLFAEDTVFRSPFAHIPLPSRDASVLILTNVIHIFENFRYHRTLVAGPYDVGLEFSANIGEFDLKGIDLIKFNAAGQIVEFEVMIRPMKALQALGARMNERIAGRLEEYKKMGAAKP